jgi:hypothetical protein
METKEIYTRQEVIDMLYILADDLDAKYVEISHPWGAVNIWICEHFKPIDNS